MYTGPIPRPSLVPPESESRKFPQKVGPTPEQVAKAITDERPSPVGQPTKVEISLRLVLPRAVLAPRAGTRPRAIVLVDSAGWAHGDRLSSSTTTRRTQHHG